MAKKATLALGVVAAVVLLLTAGCGTVDAGVHITYTDGGNLQSEITMRCTGALANYILSPEFKDSYVKSGWKVTTDVSNEATTFTATLSGKQSGSRGRSSSVSDLADGLIVVEGGNLFVKTYAVDFTMPALNAASSGTAGNEYISREQVDQMIEGMVRVSMAISLPGKVVESNADKVEADTATWYYTYKGLQAERGLRMRSERVLWANIALACLGGVLVLGSVGCCALWIGRSRRGRISGATGAQGTGSPLPLS